MGYYTLAGSKVTGVRPSVTDFNKGAVGTVIGVYGGYAGASPDFDTHFVTFPSKQEYKTAELWHINGKQPLQFMVREKKKPTDKVTMRELYDFVCEKYGLVPN